jgi:hypothetical protein
VSSTVIVIDLLQVSCRSDFIDIGNDADRAIRRNLMPAEFSPFLAPHAAKFSRPQVLRCASAVTGAGLLPDPHFIPATKRNRQEKPNATARKIPPGNGPPPSHPRLGDLSLLPQR